MIVGCDRLSSCWPLFMAVFLTGCAPTLAGSLKTTEGSLIITADARVNITSLFLSTDKRMASLKVNDKGHFSTREDLPEGDYLIEALVPGYGVASKKVHLARGGEVNLMLQPSQIHKPASIGANLNLDQGRGAGGATLMPPTL